MGYSYYVTDVQDHLLFFFFFQAEDGIRDLTVTGVQTCALPIYCARFDQRCSQTSAAKGERSMSSLKEKLKAVAAAVTAIEKQFGKGAIMSLGGDRKSVV